LPHEYQEVAYIESTGTQWIDSWYVPKSTSWFEMKFQNVSAINTYRTLIWTRTDTSNNAFWIWWMNNKCYMEFSPANIEFTSSDGWFNTGIDYEMSFLNKTLICNWVTMSSPTNFTHDAQRNLYILSWNSNWQTQPFEASAAKLYYLKLYEWENLVRDYVPCYRVSDWTIWLYDLVEWKFYWNSWTWTFKKWTPVSIWQMPSWYTELQYIKSTGTQYIDSWYDTTNDIKIESAVNFSRKYDSNVLFWTTLNSWSYWDCLCYLSSQGWFQAWAYNTDVRWTNWDANINYVVNYTLSSVTLNWDTKTYSVSAKWNRLTIMAWNTNYSELKLYYFKIYSWANLVRDFVPCVRDSDGVIWLYDLVTKEFFANSWTWNFIAWPVVYRQYKPAQYRTVAYYPLEKDTKDLSDNWYDLTNNWHVTFESIDWLLAALFDATSVPWLINTDVTKLPQGWADMTVSVWIRPTAWANSNEEDVRWLWASWTTSYTAAQLYKIFPFKAGTWGASLETSQNAVQNVWQNVIVTKSWTTWTITVNGVQIGSNTQTTSISWTNLSLWYSYRHLEGANYWYKWYMRDFIMENRAWSIEERLAYFESEKSKFGL
jgi:hypothetical protein